MPFSSEMLWSWCAAPIRKVSGHMASWGAPAVLYWNLPLPEQHWVSRLLPCSGIALLNASTSLLHKQMALGHHKQVCWPCAVLCSRGGCHRLHHADAPSRQLLQYTAHKHNFQLHSSLHVCIPLCSSVQTLSFGVPLHAQDGFKTADCISAGIKLACCALNHAQGCEKVASCI